MDKSNIKSLADNIERLMDKVKEMRKETKSAELRSRKNARKKSVNVNGLNI